MHAAAQLPVERGAEQLGWVLIGGLPHITCCSSRSAPTGGARGRAAWVGEWEGAGAPACCAWVTSACACGVPGSLSPSPRPPACPRAAAVWVLPPPEPVLDPYNNPLVTPLAEWVELPIAHELLHNAATLQVGGQQLEERVLRAAAQRRRAAGRRAPARVLTGRLGWAAGASLHGAATAQVGGQRLAAHCGRAAALARVQLVEVRPPVGSSVSDSDTSTRVAWRLPPAAGAGPHQLLPLAGAQREVGAQGSGPCCRACSLN